MVVIEYGSRSSLYSSRMRKGGLMSVPKIHMLSADGVSTECGITC